MPTGGESGSWPAPVVTAAESLCKVDVLAVDTVCVSTGCVGSKYVLCVHDGFVGSGCVACDRWGCW